MFLTTSGSDKYFYLKPKLPIGSILEICGFITDTVTSSN